MADDGAIAEARAAFVAALEHGDGRAASAVYADGARLVVPSTEVIEGRAAIEAFWSAGVRIGVTSVELEVLELRRSEGLAYEIGRYALRLQPQDGDAVVDQGNYVLVHERQPDGSWLRAVEMLTTDAVPAEVGAVHGPRRQDVDIQRDA